MVEVFLCSVQMILLGVVISIVAYFMWRSSEDRDPMLALALNALYLFVIVIYLIASVSLIGRWCG
jgi:hypothetical protein